MSASTFPGATGAEFTDFDARSLHTLADHLDEVLWMRQPTGRLSFVSRQSVAVLGAAPPQLLEDPELWPRLVPPEWHHRLVWRHPLQRIEHNTSREYPVRDGDGERWVQESCFPVRDGGGRLLQLIGATRDVTGRRRDEQALRQRLEQAHDLADHDPLTGLLNRRGLEHAARALSGGGQDTAVLLIDCDDFKRINDVHGHDAGDEVLVQIATRTRHQLRPTDCLGRLGGDEFLAVLPQTRLGEAMRIAQRITAAVGRTPIVCRGQPLSATISIGAGSLPPGCVSIGAALASADASLLASKRCGKNRVVAHADATAHAAAPAAARPPVVTSVRTLSQPLCRLDDLTVVAHELLSRGPHGSELPSLLFALAAANNTAARLDWLCLESAVAAAPRVGEGRLPLHVNVLPATLLETPVDRLAELVGRVAGGLVLEIPEQHLVGAPVRVRERMRALRELGIKVALDGLGYGCGSFEALLLLEPDIVKVDRRLVQGADRDAGRTRTLARMLGIANGLGATIVAVGIETAAERTMLLELGYTLGQGFLLGRPTPVRPWANGLPGNRIRETPRQ